LSTEKGIQVSELRVVFSGQNPACKRLEKENSSNNYSTVAILNWTAEAMWSTINRDASAAELRQESRQTGEGISPFWGNSCVSL
jgi:hypothetical protein